ncbi:hypothetical protein KEM48_013207 [Puccinia striiformis f. sp. tritici PST-130]|nr:hypothetical protein KEM48_013207 [Puccinia striiformis f. sp. tritici PST-130]
MGSAGKEDNINSEDYLSMYSFASSHNPLSFPQVLLYLSSRPDCKLEPQESPRAFMNLVPFPLSETTRLENLHHRFKRACRNKDYQKLLRRESRKDLYLTHGQR